MKNSNNKITKYSIVLTMNGVDATYKTFYNWEDLDSELETSQLLRDIIDNPVNGVSDIKINVIEQEYNK